MNIKLKTALSIIICSVVLIFGIGVGSIFIPPKYILKIIFYKITQQDKLFDITNTFIAIVWNIRLPRVLIAFLTGGSLAVSGAVMQSVMKNPLASSYTMGVSSGAALGAALVITSGFTLPVIQNFTLPLAGITFGLLSVYAAVKFAYIIDKKFENNTIILTGIVFALFINGIITLIIALNRHGTAQLIFWQMGSFSTQTIQNFFVLLPIVAVELFILILFSRELDILTFGEEQAAAMGVNIKKIKWFFLLSASILTGVSISFTGIIGFVDLIAPHLVRKIFGANHKIVIPMSFIIGGTAMVIFDMIARTILSPQEIPIGAITALIGAPFFCYVYFSGRKNE